ncbi:MAG: Cas9 inhibitor AcrIIA9 family protein [Frisingicoccus sp.]
MLERFISNTTELNKAAGHLRTQMEFDRIRKLAEEWMVPDSYVEDFIAGKRILLADIDVEEKEYKNANAKLAEELQILNDEYFSDVIGAYLCRKCKSADYESLVLQHHKTLQKCLDYVLKKAYEIAEAKHGENGMRGRNGVGIAMTSAQVFQWVDEYYALDDEKEDAEKREKAKNDFLEAKKKKEEQKKKAKDREKNRKTIQNQQGNDEKKKKETAQNVQLTFDFLNTGNGKDGDHDGEPAQQELKLE